MSIVAYTGLPGSGKSYGVVANVICPALESGRTVWTNIPLKLDLIREQYPQAQVHHFDVSDMVDRPEWCIQDVPPGCVFVLDEVWRVWPQGTKANSVPLPYKTFLAEHRHRVGADGYAQEVVLVTQDLSQISAFARDLVEKTFIAKKLDAVGASKRFRVDVYDGAIKGQSGVSSRQINKLFGKYEPSVYRLYQSHTMSQTGSSGLEQKSDKRSTVWGNPLIKYGVPSAIAAVVFGIYQVFSFFDPEKSALVATPANSETSRQVTQGDRVTPAKVLKGPRDSTQWRLSGVIQGSDGYARAFLVSANSSRVVGTRSCKQFPDTGEWYCYIDGGRVTSWTAPETLAQNRRTGLLDTVTGESASR